jgi:hypothetical protein
MQELEVRLRARLGRNTLQRLPPGFEESGQASSEETLVIHFGVLFVGIPRECQKLKLEWFSGGDSKS